MPKMRILGNALLSFITKLSSGYYNIFDSTNGYTAINIETIKKLPLKKINKRFFFESDMLFRLNIIDANVLDIPMDANYGNEKSNLKILNIIPMFIYKNIINFIKKREDYSVFVSNLNHTQIKTRFNYL
jgi:hypothetical protein